MTSHSYHDGDYYPGSSPPRGAVHHDMDPTAAAFHPPSAFRVTQSDVAAANAAAAAAAAGGEHGGIPPHSTFLGVPIPQGSGPIAHPNIPDHIWVLDPLTRKLKVPSALIVPTAATATLGTTPSLCLAFLEHRCRHPWCRQAHVPPAVVQRLRNEAQNAPTCCHEHHSPQDIVFLVTRFSSIEIGFLNGQRIAVPTSRFSVTVGLQRHLAQIVPRTKGGPSFEVSSRMVCRLHLGHRCRYLEDCNNLHVCREFEPIQRAFAELGPDRGSPVTAGTPTPPPSSAHSTPLAAGQPSPCPPSYDAVLHSGGGGGGGGGGVGSRSPPFGLPPPSPLVTPQATFTAAPMHLVPPVSHQRSSATSLHNLNSQIQQVVQHGRTYNVTVLRTGVQSDEALATLVEAQIVLFGLGRVETIDLFKMPMLNASLSKPTSPLPTPGGAPSLGMSLPALPPPLALQPAPAPGTTPGGAWSMEAANVRNGGTPQRPTPGRAAPASNQGSGDRGRPLVALFGGDTGHSPAEHQTTDPWAHQ